MASFTIWLWAGAVIFGFVSAVWLLSLPLRNSSIMDIFWGLGFIVAGVAYTLLAGAVPGRGILLLVVVLIWGIRLSLHIGVRSVGKPEDARYAAWRAEHGASWWWQSFFRVFLLQGVILWLLSVPYLFAAVVKAAPLWHWTDIAGLVLFIAGFLFESIADALLASFRKREENRGKVLDQGLWSLSRHPNYFGESLLWWGFFFIALPSAPWWTVYSPMLMTFLLVRVSGVRMLDHLLSDTKPGYRDYMERTSGFVPWPKRRNN